MHYDSGIEAQVSRGSAVQKGQLHGDEEQNKNGILFVEQNKSTSTNKQIESSSFLIQNGIGVEDELSKGLTAQKPEDEQENKTMPLIDKQNISASSEQNKCSSKIMRHSCPPLNDTTALGMVNVSRTVTPHKTPAEGLLWSQPQTPLASYDVFIPSPQTVHTELRWLTSQVNSSLLSKNNGQTVMRIQTNVSIFWGDYYVAQLCGGAMVTNLGCVLSSNGTYIPRHGVADKNLKSPDHFPVTKKRQYVPGQLLNVDQMWSFGYYHFLMEALPKLILMLPYINTSLPMTLNIQTRGDASFLTDTLNTLGLQNVSLVNCNDGLTCIADTVFTTNLLRSPINADHVPMVRHAVLKGVFGEENATGDQRRPLPSNFLQAGHGLHIVGIQRTGGRALSNHRDVVNAIQRRWPNATISVFTKFSMRDTVKLFASGHIGFGPHGAGNQNSLWMHPGSPWLPIVGSKYPLWFANYAAMAGLQVWPFGATGGLYTILNVEKFVERMEMALRHEYGGATMNGLLAREGNHTIRAVD